MVKISDYNKKEMRFLELAQQSVVQNRYTCTAFLTPEEQDVLKQTMVKEKFSSWYFYGGNESAIRNIAVFGDAHELGYQFEPPVNVVLVEPRSEKFGENLSHSDYLGALMSLGIERKTTGDIIVKGKKAWIICLESVSEYIVDNLISIRHTPVKCSLAQADVPEIKPEFTELNINVASQRADAVIGGALKLSRTKAQDLIRLERVFVNGSLIKNAGSTLKEKDVLVIRGYGKYIYDGMDSVTKKGRMYVRLRKYV